MVLTEETVKKLASILREAEETYGHEIYLLADEPYRELVYGGVQVPYLMNSYKDTLVCYSYSKSLSLPGERIGYIAVCEEMETAAAVYAAVCGAGRAPGLCLRTVTVPAGGGSLRGGDLGYLRI